MVLGFNVQSYIWSLFKTKRNYRTPMKPSELFCFKDIKKFPVAKMMDNQLVLLYFISF